MAIKSFQLFLKPLPEGEREKGINTTLKFTVDYDIGHQATNLKPLIFSQIDLAGLTENKLLFAADFEAQAPPDDFAWKNLLQMLRTTIEGGNNLTF